MTITIKLKPIRYLILLSRQGKVVRGLPLQQQTVVAHRANKSSAEACQMVNNTGATRKGQDCQRCHPASPGPTHAHVQLPRIQRCVYQAPSVPHAAAVGRSADSDLHEPDQKIVYRRYASLFFIVGCSSQDNELITLEIVHRYVEQMDKYYGNVCELDIIFNFQKAYFILDELLLAGEMQESSKKNVLRCINQQDSLEEMEVSEP
jgi:hypothetical protein